MADEAENPTPAAAAEGNAPAEDAPAPAPAPEPASESDANAEPPVEGTGASAEGAATAEGAPSDAPAPTPVSDEVRTLFVSGLPYDVREREIYNLFRVDPGYVDCSLKNPGKVPVAFVIFESQAQGLESMNRLNGSQFDPDAPFRLRIELAKANSKPKRKFDGDAYTSAAGEGGEGGEGVGEKRSRATYSNNQGGQHGGGGQGGYQFYPPADRYGAGAGGMIPVYDANQQMGAYGAMPGAFAGATDAKGNPPGTTLFVANVPRECIQAEIHDMFSRCPGYVKCRLNTKDSGPSVAFVEYSDPSFSVQALSMFNGYILRPDQRGIRIEYAKNRMLSAGGRGGGGGGGGGGDPYASNPYGNQMMGMQQQPQGYDASMGGYQQQQGYGGGGV